MQTKNLTRSVRRYKRTRSIQYAFNIYRSHWGFQNQNAFDYNKWQHDRIILEDNAARFSHQDEHRLDVLNFANKKARHLRTCSCWFCSGYKKYEKTPKMLKEAARSLDDLTDLEDSWDDAAFNADISASTSTVRRCR